jgi:hypothetical protein
MDLETIASEMERTRRELARSFARVGERPSAANMPSWEIMTESERAHLIALFDEWSADPAGFATGWQSPGARAKRPQQPPRRFADPVERAYVVAADSSAAGQDRIDAVNAIAAIVHDEQQPVETRLDAAEALGRLSGVRGAALRLER